MQAITELDRLIKEMKPIIHPEPLVYCAVTAEQMTSKMLTDSFAMINEAEAITLITSPEQAQSFGFKASETFQRIELKVYSSLEAVGLTAAVSQCLTEHNISANVIAAYHHDHILIPQKDAQKGYQALLALTQQS